jgi:hypothetical protein
MRLGATNQEIEFLNQNTTGGEVERDARKKHKRQLHIQAQEIRCLLIHSDNNLTKYCTDFPRVSRADAELSGLQIFRDILEKQSAVTREANNIKLLVTGVAITTISLGLLSIDPITGREIIEPLIRIFSEDELNNSAVETSGQQFVEVPTSRSETPIETRRFEALRSNSLPTSQEVAPSKSVIENYYELKKSYMPSEAQRAEDKL